MSRMPREKNDCANDVNVNDANILPKRLAVLRTHRPPMSAIERREQREKRNMGGWGRGIAKLWRRSYGTGKLS